MGISPWLLSSVLLFCGPGELAGAGDSGRLTGRVRSGGEPAAGAVVRVTRLDPELGALSYSKVRSAPTSADGRFEFPKLPPGSYLVDAYSHDRLLQLPVRVVLRQPVLDLPELDLLLEPAAVIAGVVKDREGRPVPGVRVFVGDGGLQAPEQEPVAILDHSSGQMIRLERGVTFPRLPITVVTTDESGSFRLAPVVPDVECSIRLGGSPPFHDRTVAGIRVARGAEAFLNVELERGATIEGRLVPAVAGDCSGVRVRLHVLEGRGWTTAWAVLTREERQAGGATTASVDPDGRFRFPQLLEGRYVLVAESERFARATSPILVISCSDQVLRTDLVLNAPREISGRVVTADGRPAPGGRVEVVAEGRLPPRLFKALGRRRVPVGPDGSFRIPSLGARSVSLRVVCLGNPPTLIESVPTGGEPLTLRLDPPERRYP